MQPVLDLIYSGGASAVFECIPDLDYDEIGVDVQDLLECNGRPLSFIRRDSVPGDATKDWRGAASGEPNELEVHVRGIEWNFEQADFVSNTPQATGRQSLQGSLVQVGDKRFLVSANSFPDDTDPKQFHEARDGDTRWGVIGVDEVKPGPDTILYIYHVRLDRS